MQRAENYRLGNIIDSEKIRPNDEAELNYDDHSGETHFTDETKIMSLLDKFNEESVDPSSSSSGIVQKKKITPESSVSLAVSDSSSGKSAESSLDDIFSHNSIFEEAQQPQMVRYEDKKIRTPDGKKSRQHQEILNDIGDAENDLNELRLKIPQYDSKRITSDEQYANEIREILIEEYQNNVMASGLRELVLGIANLVPHVFNGKRVAFGAVLPDMDGYSTHVRMNITQIKRETLMISKSFRKRTGESTMTIIKMIQLFGVPLVTTYLKNNVWGGKKKVMDIEDYNELESEEYEESDESDESS